MIEPFAGGHHRFNHLRHFSYDRSRLTMLASVRQTAMNVPPGIVSSARSGLCQRFDETKSEAESS
jgi:hypothetical protein